MATKVANSKSRQRQKELDEERELQEFIDSRSQARKELIKKILIIILCLGLVMAFCLPSITMLL